MSEADPALPLRPNLDWYRKSAKKKLDLLRKENPKAQLADAQLAVSRELGFPSWRKLKAAIDAKRSTTSSADLFTAIRADDLPRIRSLLKSSPNLVNQPEADGQTPLHTAAEKNNPETVRLLLAHGSDPNLKYGFTAHTPLSWALLTRAFKSADALLKAGVKPDLYCAAGLGDLESVKSFFNPNGGLKPGASQTGSSRFAKDGTRLPRPPETPREVISDSLYIACRNAHEPVVDFLMAKNPDLNFRSYIGGTPLHWAYFGGSKQIIDLLLKAGADPEARDDVYHCKPRSFGIMVAANWGIVDLVRDRLIEDQTLAKINDGGTTPLHQAARGGNVKIVQMLILAGADIHAVDADGKTAAQLAEESKHPELVPMLRGETPLDVTEVARKAVKAMQRAWSESHAIIERRYDDAGRKPKWEALDIQSPKLLEKQADEAIARYKKLGAYRMLSWWQTVQVNENRSAMVKPDFQPTRMLEFRKDGDEGEWQRIEWQPSQTGFARKAGRFDDLSEAIQFLQSNAPSAGEYRIFTIRRMFYATMEKNRLKIVKRHDSGREAHSPGFIAAALAAKGEQSKLTHLAREHPSILREPAVMQAAVANDQKHIVKWLIAQGADAGQHVQKSRNQSWKPIMDAAFHGDAAALKRLLKAGADPNVVSGTSHRYRPLHRIVESKQLRKRNEKHEEAVQVLLDAGADPTLRGTHNRLTPLALAAIQEWQFVKLILPRFGKLNIFHACVVADDSRVIELLKGDKSLANAKDVNGWSPLHYVCASAAFLHVDGALESQARIVKALLKAGANPSAAYENEGWPLPVLYHASGIHDNATLVEILLDAGASPYDNESIYHAAEHLHEKCLALFERRCTRKKLLEQYSLALAGLLHWGRTASTDWLLKHGANPNTVNPFYGENALHAAVRNGSSEQVVRALIRHGADPNVKDREGTTAMQLARAAGAKITKRLQDAIKANR